MDMKISSTSETYQHSEDTDSSKADFKTVYRDRIYL